MIRFKLEQEKANRITINVDGPTEKYALSFINIFNHCREYPYAFYKIENNYDNRVYVTCNPKHIDSVKEYLEDFGTIETVDEIAWNVIIPEYDAKGFDTLWPETLDDADFVVHGE